MRWGVCVIFLCRRLAVWRGDDRGFSLPVSCLGPGCCRFVAAVSTSVDRLFYLGGALWYEWLMCERIR